MIQPSHIQLQKGEKKIIELPIIFSLGLLATFSLYSQVWYRYDAYLYIRTYITPWIFYILYI